MSNTVKDLQRVLFDMLVQIDEICKENGVRYSLSSGTVLAQYATKDLFHGTMILI